ncbi:unnamed protein product, partial [Onchocerca flexuosa]|uniref:Elf-1_N domain-containing protein n=1 Tax=Onchocerca flexuosa TaxID=387005 RepID=A0A183HVN4_9BILA
YPEQQPLAEISTIVCDVINVTQAEDVCNFSLAQPDEACSITKNETSEESYPNRLQSVEMIDRPSSQLSAHSEQNPWSTRKRKNKKRKKNSRNENLGEPLCGFKILPSLETE